LESAINVFLGISQILSDFVCEVFSSFGIKSHERSFLRVSLLKENLLEFFFLRILLEKSRQKRQKKHSGKVSFRENDKNRKSEMLGKIWTIQNPHEK